MYLTWLTAFFLFYVIALKIAKERKSSVLASNAYHHRVDSLTSVVAIAVIGGSNLISNAQWLDRVGGLVISLMVVQAGWANTKAAIYELADVGIDEETKESITTAAQSTIESMSLRSGDESEASEKVELRRVQGLKSGQNYLVSLELGVPAGWQLGQLRTVEDTLRARVRAKVRGVRKISFKFVEKGMPLGGVSDDFVGSSGENSPIDGLERSSEPKKDGSEHDEGLDLSRVDGELKRRK